MARTASTSVALAQSAPADLPKSKEPISKEDVTSQFTKRWAQLKNDRDAVVMGEWTDITQQIRPRRGRYFEGAPRDNPSQRRSKYIINSTPTTASRTLGGGMMSGVSSPARPWFRLKSPVDALNEVRNVKQWLFKTNTTIQTILAKSNFYDQVQVMYRDLGDFGNSLMIADEDYEDVARFTVFPPGTYAWATDKKGRVHSVYYRFHASVLSLVKEYGYENCSDRVQDQYDRQSYDEMVPCIVAIEPNMQQVPGLGGPRGWPWVAVHFEEASRNSARQGYDPNRILRKSGYREWPCATPRWDIQSGEDYGSGPGLDALGDCRALQELEKEKGKAIKKLVTPPTQAPIPAGSNVSHIPGGTTFTPTTAAQGAMIRPIYEQSAQGINAIAEEIAKHEKRIREAYYADLFLMLAQDTRRQPITAREIEERHEEKLLALGPVLERLHNEALNVLVERTFWIALRAGLIDPIPEELGGMALKIDYTSILAMAQKAVNVGSWDRFLGTIGNLAGLFPGIVDKINADQVVDEYAAIMDVPPTIIHTDDEVDQKRQSSQQAQAGAALPEQAGAAVDMAKAAQVASETRVNQGSALEQILGRGSAST